VALHFAPTATSRQNLLDKGVPADHIVVTGNTLIDALFLALDRVRAQPPAFFRAAWDDLPLVLITGHRRENHGNGLESICQAIVTLARRFPHTQFIYPVHLNPKVREPVQGLLGTEQLTNIHLPEPLPYLEFVALLDRATLVLTDSGSVQEEAPSLGKPVLVLRETTERPEAVSAGTVRLVGTDCGCIVNETTRLLTDPSAYDAMARAHNPYGDGQAAQRIVNACLAYLDPALARRSVVGNGVYEAGKNGA
jgi:UDP-N-acetylglucosamine 2-epimerase (non-hydrolysing)